MGTFYDHLTDSQTALIKTSQMFFIATVDPQLKASSEGAGPVNLSPKGRTQLHVISKSKVAYLDFPGSGNQTAIHIQLGSPVTLMVMSMDTNDPAIIRVYGHGKAHSVKDYPHQEVVQQIPIEELDRSRQIIEVTIEKTQTSCGYGVPKYQFLGQRSKEERGRRYKFP